MLHLLPLLIGGTLIITEIQPVPNGEPEWIEIVNTTERTVRIDDWTICDLRACVRLPRASLPARGTCIVTRDAEGLRQTRDVPDDVIVVEVSLPSFNNSTERVEMRDDDSVIVDTLSYDMKQFTKGRSIERIGTCNNNDVNGSEEESAAGAECIAWTDSWSSNVSSDSSTCGRFNSVISIPYDLRISAIKILDASVAVDIVNHGSKPMHGVNIEVKADQWNVETTTTALLPGEMFTWEIPIASIGGYSETRDVLFTANIRVVDGRNSNDKLSVSVTYPPPPNTIVLSEIMFDPWSPMKDYVELYNGSNDTIDLQGWSVEDVGGARGAVSVPCVLSPGEYAVLSSSDAVRSMMKGGVLGLIKPDVSWNLEGDKVVLRTPHGFLVDVFSYTKEWHSPELENSKGVSLEKRDVLFVSDAQSSWTSSGDLSGGTPGRANNVGVGLEIGGSLSSNPKVFSSDRTHATNPVALTFTQPFRHAIASMNVFSREGAPIRTLLNSVFCGSTGAVAWDGTDGSGMRVRPGPYVVVMESVDAGSANVIRSSCVVVVAE